MSQVVGLFFHALPLGNDNPPLLHRQVAIEVHVLHAVRLNLHRQFQHAWRADLVSGPCSPNEVNAFHQAAALAHDLLDFAVREHVGTLEHHVLKKCEIYR